MKLERYKLLFFCSQSLRTFSPPWPCVSPLSFKELNERAKGFNLILDDVAITHLVFGKEFTSAIEQKQVAQQQAERQEYVVKKSAQEKLAAIIRAEGEAEAADIVTQALQVRIPAQLLIGCELAVREACPFLVPHSTSITCSFVSHRSVVRGSSK